MSEPRIFRLCERLASCFLATADLAPRGSKKREPLRVLTEYVPQLKIGESVSLGHNRDNQTIATKSKWYGKFLSVSYLFIFVSLVVVVRIIIAGFNLVYSSTWLLSEKVRVFLTPRGTRWRDRL